MVLGMPDANNETVFGDGSLEKVMRVRWNIQIRNAFSLLRCILQGCRPFLHDLSALEYLLLLGE